MSRRNDEGYLLPLEVEELEDPSIMLMNNVEREEASLFDSVSENTDFLTLLGLKLSLNQYRAMGVIAFITFLVLLATVFAPNQRPQRFAIPSQALPQTIFIEDSNITYPRFSSVFNRSQEKPFQLLLFGDSLIDVPWKCFQLRSNLYDNIMERVVNASDFMFNVTISHTASSGARISNLKESLSSLFLDNHTYDGIILFWDSDISDQEVSILEMSEVQEKYQDDLRYVITFLKQRTPLVGIAGPGLLGEGPLLLQFKFHNKEPLLNLYQQFNQQISQELNISYLNIRRGFQELIPSYHLFSFGYVTRDGEHPNAFGTQVIAKYFATQFLRWYDQD